MDYQVFSSSQVLWSCSFGLSYTQQKNLLSPLRFEGVGGFIYDMKSLGAFSSISDILAFNETSAPLSSRANLLGGEKSSCISEISTDSEEVLVVSLEDIVA